MKVQIYSFVFLALLAVAYAVTECPAEDGEEVVQFSNLADCSTFYKCWKGEAYLTECPSGLQYNAELGVCDWPANSLCVASAAAEEEVEK